MKFSYISTTLASQKNLEIGWPDNVTTVDFHKNFLEILMVDLCHSQLITESINTQKREDSRSSIH